MKSAGIYLHCVAKTNGGDRHQTVLLKKWSVCVCVRTGWFIVLACQTEREVITSSSRCDTNFSKKRKRHYRMASKKKNSTLECNVLKIKNKRSHSCEIISHEKWCNRLLGNTTQPRLSQENRSCRVSQHEKIMKRLMQDEEWEYSLIFHMYLHGESFIWKILHWMMNHLVLKFVNHQEINK